MRAVFFGLEPVQRGLRALLSSGVTAGSSSIPCLHEVRPVVGASVPIPAGPVPIDLGLASIQGGVFSRGEASRLVTLVSGQIASSRSYVTAVSGDITGHCPVQNAVYIGVAPSARPISLVRDEVTLISHAVPTISRDVTLVSEAITLISRPVPDIAGLRTVLRTAPGVSH